MARHEADREDLMSEAVSLVRRAEFVTPGEVELVVAGFKASGDMSIYFGADPVFHFDALGRMRRAWCQGLLYRTQGTTLARLARQRSKTATRLVRHDLSPDELHPFLAMSGERLRAFRRDVSEGRATMTRQVPDDGTAFLPEILARIDAVLAGGVPLAPAICGKR
jgi:hypothetical protein